MVRLFFLYFLKLHIFLLPFKIKRGGGKTHRTPYFKPRHSFVVEMGGYAKTEDSESKCWCAGMEYIERKDDNDRWIKIGRTQL